LRYKTFNATGIAPDGRLYAGDLNGIQDLYLPLSDFTSTVDVGTLRVGDPSLQLLKYGAGEFRMSGAMRLDGIMRGLGGLVAGAFTTAQRNAIPAALRPYGLVILNTTTNLYEWNKGTSSVPVWESLGGGLPAPHASTHLPGGSDPINFATAVHMAGTRAAKPTAATANNGLLYFETDWNQTWRSNGSAWQRIGMSPRKVAPSEIPGLSAIDGDEIMVVVAANSNWHMRYNAFEGAYKWEFLGGPPMFAEITVADLISSSSYVDASTPGPTIVLPRAGIYDIEIGLRTFFTGQSTDMNYTWMSYSIGATGASDADAVIVGMESGLPSNGPSSRPRRKTISAAETLTAKYKRTAEATATNKSIDSRWMRVYPVAIA
jgi:hypothetical protein